MTGISAYASPSSHATVDRPVPQINEGNPATVMKWPVVRNRTSPLSTALVLLFAAVLQPAVADTEVTEYRFTSRERIDPRTNTLTQAAVFGRALIACTSKQFVYEVWCDGDPERILVAAGCDGSTYWYARSGGGLPE